MQAHFYVVENKKGHKALILEGTNFGQGNVLAETQFTGKGNRSDEIRSDWAFSKAKRLGVELVEV